MNLKEFTIRKYNDSDIQGVLDLWEHHSGWGKLEAKEYEKWLQTPYGNCIVLVAVYQNKQIVGQLMFTPTELWMDGKKLRALRLSAPIVHKDFRGRNVMKPDSLIMQMFFEGNKILKNSDYEWVYCFPAIGWSKIMGLLHHHGLSPWKSDFYDCYEIMGSDTEASEISLRIIDEFPVEIKGIWSQFQVLNNDKSFITRNPQWLKYKWGDDIKVGIYDAADVLIGYVVIKQKSGLILDLVILNWELIEAVLSNLKVLFDAFMESKKLPNPGLKLMETDFFSNAIKRVNVKPVDYQFVFGLSAMNNLDTLNNVDLNDWYVFPND